MLKKLRILFTILPSLAMVVAIIIYVKSLFYNFHEDTVPFFSFVISSIITIFYIFLGIGAIICAYCSIRSNTSSHQSLLICTIFLLNFLFSAVCVIVGCEQLKIIVIYFLTTSLLLLSSLILCRIKL